MRSHRMRTLILAGLAFSLNISIVLSTPRPAISEGAQAVLQTYRTEYVSRAQNDTSIKYVANSGICETTPGVKQISGYLDVGANMSMWFWFFESRNEPETAPFALWLNGGPGCSSMLGLFQENGPCHVTPDGNATFINPYSWNNISNIMYIDQPIGSGFSYGTVDVNSTFAAAPAVWKAMQILFESGEFSEYQSREFIFGTESYGGHYGPAFVTYFDEQNAKIENGSLEGEQINVSALMINNGWYDPLLQNEAYVTFATYAPGYGQLQNDTVIAQLNEAFYGPGGCREQELNCYATGETPESNKICRTADAYCIDYVLVPAVGDRDVDDLRQNSSALFPPEYYVTYLQDPEVMKAIGAESNYVECSDPVDSEFERTGDDARTWLPQLSGLANSGLKMLIWAGDADINCNWLGGHASVLAMDWYGNKTLHNTPFTNMTIAGKPVAAVQNVDNFTFARVYEAGHEVAAFQPQAALEIFSQVIKKEPLHSVP
ncbi:alpha/beta-hydrolase [Wolfiporia cocos MD-104 SS10]|uniref:Alpha/beta-hydrolase n=1 Tax=Wolfiporia cocos (strain MD-104) TaxID=742152 RepID=A0A2H3JFV4_WOLCO|nr:alpha/beta-hydrolase [Wolfiporia cocos MD-104 SS10]